MDFPKRLIKYYQKTILFKIAGERYVGICNRIDYRYSGASYLDVTISEALDKDCFYYVGETCVITEDEVVSFVTDPQEIMRNILTQ